MNENTKNQEKHVRAVIASIEQIFKNATCEQAASFAMKLQLLANAAACKKDALESQANGDIELAMLDENRVKTAIHAAREI